MSTTGPDPTGSDPQHDAAEIDLEVAFLDELVEEGVGVDGDVIELGSTTFAVHGNAAYGGEIILAEFEHADDARTTIDRLEPPEPPLSG